MNRSSTHRILAGIAAVALAGLSILVSCAKSSPEALTIWTYDSFVAEWGPGAKIAALFKEKTGTDIRFVAKGDGGALLAALLAEGKAAKADAVVGLDDRLAPRALESGLFDVTDSRYLAAMPASILVDPGKRLLPYDFGHFAFMWDSTSSTPAPKSLEDLTSPVYRKKVIIMDPRTSTPGLGFLAWVQSIYGDGWQDYLIRLAPSLLAMTPGWDVGYGLFTSGEAPLALSYSTSPAYHLAYEKTERYKALEFSQGHPAQIELAGVLRASRNRKAARAFIDFLLSPECQTLLPETQWMYPANPDAPLPESFRVAPKPQITLAAPLRNPAKDPDTAATMLSSAKK